MPRNSSGTFTLLNAAFTPGTIISSNAVNGDLSDIATGLTQSLATTGVSSMTGQLKAIDGTVGAPGYTFGSDTVTGIYRIGLGQVGITGASSQIASFSATAATFPGTVSGTTFLNANGIASSVPVGTVLDYSGASAPTGWFLCAGQAISRTTYAALFAVTGTTYGVGDGVTTFNVPDCRGRATYGQDNMGGVAASRITAAGGNFDGTVLGGSGGLQNHTMTSGDLVSHTHTANVTDPQHSHSILGATVQDNSGSRPTIAPPVNVGIGGNESANGTYVAANNEANKYIQPTTTGITVANTNTGSGNPFTVLGPAIIFTKIIFAGHT